jgi:nitrate/nitrite-specific signal transduction histidine kinase
METKTKTREVHELSILYEISQLLTSTRPVHDTLTEILDLLSHKMSMTRATITLRNPDSDELQIEIAHGLSDKEKKMGLYKLGEGITGRVVQTGKPNIISASGSACPGGCPGSHKRVENNIVRTGGQLNELFNQLDREDGRVLVPTDRLHRTLEHVPVHLPAGHADDGEPLRFHLSQSAARLAAKRQGVDAHDLHAKPDHLAPPNRLDGLC